MALDTFNIKINKLHVLPESLTSQNSFLYGSANNVVYGAEITATGVKQKVEVTKDIDNVHFVYTSKAEDFVHYSNLTEEMVLNWVNDALIMQRGNTAIIDIQQELEDKANTIIQAQGPALPWQN